jgi:AcrR family transcriptional regulator
MTDTAALRDAIADAALTLAASRPWSDISLRDLAEAAGSPMAGLYGAIASKDDVLDAIAARLDRSAADGLEIEREAPVRERLFDAAMARFDAMEARRAGLASILRAEMGRPLAAAARWPRLLRTARWLMELAGEDSGGPLGLARANVFAAVLARTTGAWLEDDGGDLARTMATLDRALRDLESWRERMRPRGRTSDAASGAATPEQQPSGQPVGDAPG